MTPDIVQPPLTRPLSAPKAGSGVPQSQPAASSEVDIAKASGLPMTSITSQTAAVSQSRVTASQANPPVQDIERVLKPYGVPMLPETQVEREAAKSDA